MILLGFVGGFLFTSSVYLPTLLNVDSGNKTLIIPSQTKIMSTNQPSTNDATSILLVVNGGWALPDYRTPKRQDFLETIIKNALEMCEAGYFVSLFLITYEPELDQISSFFEWMPMDMLLQQKCKRTNSTIDIRLRLFPKLPLRSSQFGTGGNLGIRHREIFQAHKDYYDYFVIQEDDVLFTESLLTYYVESWERVLNARPKEQTSPFGQLRSHYGRRLVPGFLRYETVQDQKYVSWRLNGGIVERIGNHTFFTADAMSYSYLTVVPSELLKELVVSHPNYTDMETITGEFNPQCAEGGFNKIANTRSAIRVQDIQNSFFHHMSNKYIASLTKPDNLAEERHMFLSMKDDEAQYVYKSCLPDFNHSKFPNIMFSGEEGCFQCLQKSKTATSQFRIQHVRIFNGSTYLGNHLNVTVQCWEDTSIG